MRSNKIVTRAGCLYLHMSGQILILRVEKKSSDGLN